jgi:hypothetical protein
VRCDALVRVLIACEMSARVRDEFRRWGHDAWSADILPTTGDPAWHIQGDVLPLLNRRWDLMVAFPPCTHLSLAGAVHWKEKQADGRQQEALDFVRTLMDADIPRIAIENPAGAINSQIRKPDQIIQPFYFGDPWAKRTCLWLKGLPRLVPDQPVEKQGHWLWTRRHSGEIVGSDTLLGHKNRHIARSLTFAGVARSMAAQWGAKGVTHYGSPSICYIDECNSLARRKAMCDKHYMRARRNAA